MLALTLCAYMASLRPFSKCRPRKMTIRQNSDFPHSSFYLSQSYNNYLYMYLLKRDKSYWIKHKTRWVDGTPTSEVTPVTIWQILTPDLGHQMVKITFNLENSNVKVTAKVNPIDHIWGLEFNRYVCFSFRGNRTAFGWDLVNSIFDLENQG